MIVYLKVCLFGNLSAFPNWESAFPVKLVRNIQSAYCYFCLEGDPWGSVTGPAEVFAYREWENSPSPGTHQLRLHRTGLPVFRPACVLASGDKALSRLILAANPRGRAVGSEYLI